MNEKEKGQETKLQEASQLLEKERKTLIKLCTEEINSILEKHGCIIEVAMLISATGTMPIVNIVPQPQQNPQ